MISKDQAERSADALLQVAQAESDARLVRRWGFPRYPELSGTPSQRAAIWREAMAATRWEWPVMLVASIVIVPDIALLVLAALSLTYVKPATLPHFLCFLTPFGLIAIQRVHRKCAQRYLRSKGRQGSIHRPSE